MIVRRIRCGSSFKIGGTSSRRRRRYTTRARDEDCPEVRIRPGDVTPDRLRYTEAGGDEQFLGKPRGNFEFAPIVMRITDILGDPDELAAMDDVGLE